MWETWKMAKLYNCRPSDILGITNTAARFHADRATMIFCESVENAMAVVDKSKQKSEALKSAERMRILDHWLGNTAPVGTSTTAGRFRDPAAKFTK